MTAGRRRRRRWPWVVLFLGIVLVALFFVGGGWYFSGQVYDEALKSEPYDPTSLEAGVIEAADISEGEGTITLAPSPQDADETKFDDATMGLQSGESLLVVGPATVAADGTSTRPVLEVVGQAPEAGDSYGLVRDVWLTPEEAGLEFEDVTITTPEGDAFPAWLIPGKSSKRWAILTHGKGAARSEMLRMARPLHDAGYTVLVITYRGDVGAPEYPDGQVGYGRSEWRELESAVEYASANGAERIVLGGVSHGGAVTLGFMARSPLAARVDAIILDAPATSLGEMIDQVGESRSLPVVNAPIPESLEEAAKLMVAWRYGVSFSQIDYIDAPPIAVPLLIFQGSDDGTVPQAVNDRF
ncbi:MAG TPA: hypothetical protein VF143_04310, partial [Candidatus Nanopelagicales bacterium]